MFRVGSITKGFVALSALQLAERGKLSLDEKVSDVAPEIPVVNPWAATNPVTLAQLLEHTAGFDDFSLAEFYDFDAAPNDPHPRPLLLDPHAFHRSRACAMAPRVADLVLESRLRAGRLYCRENGGRAARKLHRGKYYASARDGAFGHAADARREGRARARLRRRRAAALLPDISAACGRDEVVGERDGAIRPHDAESRRARRRQDRQSGIDRENGNARDFAGRPRRPEGRLWAGQFRGRRRAADATWARRRNRRLPVALRLRAGGGRRLFFFDQ